MKWYYHVARRTFIREDGEIMAPATLREVRNDYLSSMDGLLDDYAENLASGAWTVTQFESAMRDRLRKAYMAEYTLGKGGIARMVPRDYRVLGGLLKNQYGYLRGYLDDLVAGRETSGTAARRARLFLGSAVQAFERGQAAAWGIRLPGYPGDGKTECYGNCRCWWQIEEDAEEIRAYWQVSGDEGACAGCERRGQRWSPYTQKRS